ncbi:MULTISPECIES: M23 family metallopeptidase [unclassified Methylobacterium]|jgi:murein DD-endopeptidase MepM/ murein hydrolase activator NlpD|uniref:M23 family metallopeptidase n=1 Tax=unclassified Methylobacterium TaxID=2615210 RepID=UPI001352E5E0|nr:M23 family metallopeptidase [Methylobacterium sp. 2A]MWV25851.1 M23 family metallopeptidase [Methylobacterium sp. 2A]
MHRSKISSRLPSLRATPWLAAALALALLWALGATYLIVFHDEVLAGFVARQAALRDAYEAQLAELRDRLDRDRRDQAGTETGLADRVAAALARQAELERRTASLAEVARQTAPDPVATGALARRPGIGSAPVDDELDLRSGDGAEPARALPRRSALDVETGLIRLEARLEGLQAAQGARLAGLAARAGDEIRRLRGLILRTGLDPGRFDAPEAGVGGPLVPLDSRVLDGAGFEASLALARRALADGERLRRTTAGLPLGRPIRGEAIVSSPFGSRLDPFTRGLALHTGLDLKAEYGEPARATAPGRVIAAEAAGGYGNMVEIDHGHGLTTRFGHLARIAVYPGQRVAAGDTVGSVGSTGRSTGAHLHYETRIDGVPVDPQRFLAAGATRAQHDAD